MTAFSRLLAARSFIARWKAIEWLTLIVMLAAGSWLGHLLSDSTTWTDWRYKIYYRQMQLQHHGALYPRRTALVLLDNDDYWGTGFGARTPLKRNLLATLLGQLDKAGVKAVALDVDLRAPWPKQPGFEFDDYAREDGVLFTGIGTLCGHGVHVVLTSSISYDGDGYHRMPGLYDGKPELAPCLKDAKNPLLTTGYIQIPYDMRRIPGALDIDDNKTLDSLSLAVTRLEDPIAADRASTDNGGGFRFSQYLTAKDFDPRDGREFTFSGHGLMQMKDPELKEQLGGKLVFVGAHWQADAYQTGPFVDTHNSPGGVEPGVMLHANYVEAMLENTGTLTPLSDNTAEAIEIVLVLVLAVVAKLGVHAGWKWGAFAATCLVSVLLTYFLMQSLGLFLDFAIPLLVLILHTLLDKEIELREEVRQLRRELKERPAAGASSAPTDGGSV